jgi:hypothetical protein
MARIRSVHPGLFTDEAFAFLSDAAQMFIVGLWTECDDQGAFVWSPNTLRLKLRPGKDGPVDLLLDELEAANVILSYTHEGRKYGLVRNFLKYQRPKKPNLIHFIPEKFRTYNGLRQDSSELHNDEEHEVPHQFPTSSEISNQMEDGGDKMEDGGGVIDTPSPQIAIDAWNETAARIKIPRKQAITPEHRKKIGLRIKELGGIRGWFLMLKKIENSKYLRGEINGWRVTLDWVLSPKNLAKIMEGNYDDKSGNGGYVAKSIGELIQELVEPIDATGDRPVFDLGPGDVQHSFDTD